MIKGITYTKKMDKMIAEYQRENLLTIEELMQRAELAESALYKFRSRGKIGLSSVKKIKENLGVDLLQK